MRGLLKYALIGGAAYLLWKKFGGAASGTGLHPKLKPASLKPGEEVNAQSYRVIKRRPNMTYVPAEGSPGSAIKFTSAQGGTFTRNVVMENGQLWAEIAL